MLLNKQHRAHKTNPRIKANLKSLVSNPGKSLLKNIDCVWLKPAYCLFYFRPLKWDGNELGLFAYFMLFIAVWLQPTWIRRLLAGFSQILRIADAKSDFPGLKSLVISNLNLFSFLCNKLKESDLDMAWFKRESKGIITTTEEKKEAPDGIWNKCPQCKKPLHYSEEVENQYVCHYCGFHMRIGSKEYFSILFDNNEFTELFDNLISGDPLHFEDTKKYTDRLKETIKKTGLKDALRSAAGKIDGQDLVIACMDFNFIGGSMGSVVGEKIARSIDYCIEHQVPLMIISKSGGARMMEAAFSLMQMAKTSAKLALLAQAKVPYISLLTDPTTGGVSASYAMLGDINIAEPGALIGFAGPRVIKETIKKDLPKGFQTAEFVQEHGFLDFIVDRREMKQKIATFLKMMAN
jgi:acetyl-CoA carboxylase carboxyl transferase subunit beta